MSATPNPDKTINIQTNKTKLWPYEEYYIGEVDSEERRNGDGENHWSSAESLEWYTGSFHRNTMNGYGDYRWRFRGPDGDFITYEGSFFVNSLHGYGVMSYPNGKVFTGLYHGNVRWGPGIEAYTHLQVNVGLWRGTQLIRLAWRPQAPSITVDLTSTINGRALVEKHRIVLARTTKTIGETNSAMELLKQQGAEPMSAAVNWPRLYSKHCTDILSPACDVKSFENDFYKGQMQMLQEVSSDEDFDKIKYQIQGGKGEPVAYYAWNNNSNIVHMMKHCYQHDYQRCSVGISLTKILNGPRRLFRPPGKQERDCRLLLMCAYLGNIVEVAQLVNEEEIYADLCDDQGNTALMYATCADQTTIMHFLIDAGANVNTFNDSCCTALGLALLKYVCVQKDIPLNNMAQVVPASMDETLVERIITDWQINRVESSGADISLAKSMSYTSKNFIARKSRLSLTKKSDSQIKAKIKGPEIGVINERSERDDSSSEKLKFIKITNEYETKVNGAYTATGGVATDIFTVTDMMQEVDAYHESIKHIDSDSKNHHKKGAKNGKDAVKPSKEIVWHSSNKDMSSVNTDDMFKLDRLSNCMLAILQLLSDGADPNLVRCPRSSLYLAVMSESSELVRHLVRYGVNINETYPYAYNYTALDLAVSRPFCFDNLEVVRALVENGAITTHRLQYEGEPGPTLLHAVLARPITFDFETEIQSQMLELLVEFNCDATAQFKGYSALEMILNKNLDLLDVIIKNAKINLNKVINSDNQTVLVKMFSIPYFKSLSGIDRFPIFTKLLLYGADPLIKCQDKDEKFGNIFVFAKKNLEELEAPFRIQITDNKSKIDTKNVKKDTSETNVKKDNKQKPVGKPNADDVVDFKMALDLVTECARLLHIRWLQAKLMKDLIATIDKFKHRPWNMIIKEYKDSKSIGLWLTPQRCLEIWDILKSTKKKIYKERRILKHLLCIVQFHNKRAKSYVNPGCTGSEKTMIEFDVGHLLNEHLIASILAAEAEVWKGIYVKPELSVGMDKKFNVCFECALPLDDADDTKLKCSICKLVSFCSLECQENNIDRVACHPCSEYLRHSSAVTVEL